MNMLKTLTFITAPTQVNDPTVRRRGKLIERLEQQKALFSNPAHHITEQRWVKDENGTKQLLQKQKRIRRWWRTDLSGNTTLVVRYGAKPLEFEKGKTAIAIGDKAGLLDVLDALIGATQSGELDQIIPKPQPLRDAVKLANARKVV